MKVLFIGEGPHEIGPGDGNSFQPQQAGGVLFVLVRRVCPHVAEDSLALKWTDISRFNSDARKRGFEGKIKAAIVLSARKFDCGGTVCVVDQDRDKKRLPALREGRERGLQLAGATHAVACGVAIKSIEAWTLGAPTALGETLEIEAKAMQKVYNPADAESFYENSGKEEYRPKALLEQVAQLAGQHDGLELRLAVGELTDLGELERNCPAGFKPFADALRAAFPPKP